MAKASSPDEFSEILTRDFTWRLRELSDLKIVADCPDVAKVRGRRRSLIVMCYAHWEGHVKYCAEKFIEYITIRRLRFADVSEHFYLLRFTNLISGGNNLGLQGKMEIVSRILGGGDDRLSHIPDGIINTRSNLNSAVLNEICLVCGVPFECFDQDMDFLDRILLKRRNEVAHGEAVFTESIDPDDLVDRTTAIMRLFRDSLDNSIATGGYRRIEA